METAVEGPGKCKAVTSNLFSPRFLGHLVLQFTVHFMGKASEVSSVDSSPCLSSAAASVALSEQDSYSR